MLTYRTSMRINGFKNRYFQHLIYCSFIMLIQKLNEFFFIFHSTNYNVVKLCFLKKIYIFILKASFFFFRFGHLETTLFSFSYGSILSFFVYIYFPSFAQSTSYECLRLTLKLSIALTLSLGGTALKTKT